MTKYKLKTDIILERENNTTTKVFLSCAYPNKQDIILKKDSFIQLILIDKMNISISVNDITYNTYDMYSSPYKYFIDTNIEFKAMKYINLINKSLEGSIEAITTKLYEFTSKHPNFIDLFVNNKSFQYEIVYYLNFIFDGDSCRLICKHKNKEELFALCIEISKFKTKLINLLTAGKETII